MQSKKILNLFEKSTYIIFGIFILFWSIAEFDPQTAVDGGLIISGKVIFPQEYSNVTSIYFNGWNTLHQISALLLKIGISQEIISWLFVFFFIFCTDDWSISNFIFLIRVKNNFFVNNTCFFYYSKTFGSC